MKMERKPTVGSGCVDPDPVKNMRGKQKQTLRSRRVFVTLHQIIRISFQEEKYFIEVMTMKRKIFCGVLGDIISEVYFIRKNFDALVHGRGAPLAVNKPACEARRLINKPAYEARRLMITLV